MSYAYSWTTLILVGAAPADDVVADRLSLTAALERALSERWSLQVGAGAMLGGRMTVGRIRHDAAAGPLVIAAASYRLLDERKSAPFVLLGGSLGGSHQATRSRVDGRDTGHLVSTDVRAGVTVGATLGDVLSAYAAARIFGGPVLWWRDGLTSGSDPRHYQVGLGAAVRAGRLDAFAEIAPLGEHAAIAGAGVSF